MSAPAIHEKWPAGTICEIDKEGAPCFQSIPLNGSDTVPLQATKAYGRGQAVLYTFLTRSIDRSGFSALCPGRFTPGKWADVPYWTGDRQGSTAGPEALGKSISVPAWESKHPVAALTSLSLLLVPKLSSQIYVNKVRQNGTDFTVMTSKKKPDTMDKPEEHRRGSKGSPLWGAKNFSSVGYESRRNEL